MKIGILGSGNVGKAMYDGLSKKGHEIKVGSRTIKTEEKFTTVSFEEAASFGELLILAYKGEAFNDILDAAGPENFSGKTIIDVTNPLVFEEGKTPALSIGYPDSLGKRHQSILSEAKVVKAFNTVPAHYMCNPKLEDGRPILFIAGDHGDANKLVSTMAEDWGWETDIIGSIDQAYLLEAFALLWITYGFNHNYWQHAFGLLKK